MLGIPFYVWDLAERFHADVVDDFVAEYAAGRTPNPCLRCNEKIKFAAVLDRALALGFDAVVHRPLRPARRGPDGASCTARVDPAKDQSYVLGVLDREQLAHSMFPLGDSTKAEVRAEAARRGLAVADKPDSHDICFIADGDTAGLPARAARGAAGRGRRRVRRGASARTPAPTRSPSASAVGSRSACPPPTAGRATCCRITPVTNTVTVGPAEALDVTTLVGERSVWLADPRSLTPTALFAQVRAHGAPVRCDLTTDGDRIEVVLHEPVRGAAPGQGLVIYAGTRVVGSATLTTHP